MSDPFCPVCVCGHVVEEHGEGFFRECKKCECQDFEGQEEGEEDEPQTLGDA